MNLPVEGQPQASIPLLLDEMFSPKIADELCRRGQDVVALVADPELSALSDAATYARAGEHCRRVLTQNAKDLRGMVTGDSASGSGPGGAVHQQLNVPA